MWPTFSSCLSHVMSFNVSIGPALSSYVPRRSQAHVHRAMHRSGLKGWTTMKAGYSSVSIFQVGDKLVPLLFLVPLFLGLCLFFKGVPSHQCISPQQQQQTVARVGETTLLPSPAPPISCNISLAYFSHCTFAPLEHPPLFDICIVLAQFTETSLRGTHWLAKLGEAEEMRFLAEWGCLLF